MESVNWPLCVKSVESVKMKEVDLKQLSGPRPLRGSWSSLREVDGEHAVIQPLPLTDSHSQLPTVEFLFTVSESRFI